jgi:hypothetical protein
MLRCAFGTLVQSKPGYPMRSDERLLDIISFIELQRHPPAFFYFITPISSTINQHINFRTELSLFFLLYTLLTSSNMYEYIEYVDNNRHREKVQLPDVELPIALSFPGNIPDRFLHVFNMSYFKTQTARRHIKDLKNSDVVAFVLYH